MPLDPEAFSDLVIDTVERAVAPLYARIALLEATKAAPATVPDELSPEDMAASVAGLLRKELDDLTARPAATRKRIEKDATGYTVTEEVLA